MTSRYELQERLGQGGSGVVYKALDVQLQRAVAIKRLAQRSTDEDSVEGSGSTTHGTQESLRNEALALSALQHPNIVTVHDIGSDSDGPFVVMEYLEGQTLETVVEHAPLPLKEFTTLVQDALSGLGAAHARGMLHRDLKPSNIMLVWLPTQEMQFKLLDFGIAKYSPVPSEQTTDVSGSVMGTIYFMAPEQFERAALDARSDLYSLGCTFFFALTGRYPFTADSAAGVMAAHLQHLPGPLAEWRPDLPAPVVQWVLQLMSRVPEGRPDTAAQALALYKRALQPQATPLPHAGQLLARRQMQAAAQSATRSPVAAEPPRKSGGKVLLVMALVLLALAGGGGYAAWRVKEAAAEGVAFAKKTLEASLPPASSQPALAQQAVPAIRETSDNPPAPDTPPAPAMVPAEPASPAPAPQPPPDVSVASGPLPPTALDRLRTLVNQPVEVEGVVVSVGESKSGKTRYVNFSRRPGESLSLAFRTSETDTAFPKSRLESFAGTKIRARGRVTEFNGNLLIYIEQEKDVTKSE